VEHGQEVAFTQQIANPKIVAEAPEDEEQQGGPSGQSSEGVQKVDGEGHARHPVLGVDSFQQQLATLQQQRVRPPGARSTVSSSTGPWSWERQTQRPIARCRQQ
jgi:hypothetical protein